MTIVNKKIGVVFVAQSGTSFKHKEPRFSTQPGTANNVNFGTGSLSPEQTKRHSDSRDLNGEEKKEIPCGP